LVVAGGLTSTVFRRMRAWQRVDRVGCPPSSAWQEFVSWGRGLVNGRTPAFTLFAPAFGSVNGVGR
jgi:hypothetical protein